MSSHSENARTTIEYRGSRIECSDAVSAKCLKAIEIEDKEEFADLISAKGANLNELCVCWVTCDNDSRPERYTATPLTLAAKFASCDFILWMLKHGADPNVKCDLTPLCVAVSMNNKRLVSLLVDSGAHVNLKSLDTDNESRNFTQTPLHIACSKRFFTMAIFLLLKGALPDVPKTENRLAGGAIENERWKRGEIFPTGVPGTVHSNVMKYMKWKRGEIFPTSHPHDFFCKTEIENTFSWSSDCEKNTPLHYACADGDEWSVILLLQKSAKICARNIENQSPAEVAFDFGRLKIVFMLIKRGCHLSQRMLSDTYSCGNTLLHIACQQGRESVAKKLIEAGASLSVTNNEGKSAMHYAWRKPGLRSIVLDYVFQCASFVNEFAPPHTRVGRLQSRANYMRFLRHDNLPADDLALYETLCTVVSEEPLDPLSADALCSWCGKLTPEACYLLRRRGMLDDVLLLSSCCGSSYANKQLVLQLHRAEVTQSSESDLKLSIEEWIQKGANVNAVDCYGNTPLHIACGDGASKGTSILLDCGANLYAVNNYGRTPLDCAADKQLGQLLLSTIDRVDDDILSTVSSKREASTKLQMLARAGVLSQQLAYRLACDGARIRPNSPATSSCDSNAPRCYSNCLLNILAWNGKWGVVCELIRMGCCDYTDDMFKCMFQISFRDQTPSYNKVQMWTWFSLAGFWKNNDFTAQFESFLEVKFHHLQHESDTHTDASAATATSELKWLKNDVRNPPSLLRQCVYTIRRQLIFADTTGRTIFPSIEKLPLPTRLKDYLKLEALRHEICMYEDQVLRPIPYPDIVGVGHRCVNTASLKRNIRIARRQHGKRPRTVSERTSSQTTFEIQTECELQTRSEVETQMEHCSATAPTALN